MMTVQTVLSGRYCSFWYSPHQTITPIALAHYRKFFVSWGLLMMEVGADLL